jgi:type IV pilus assembly protein PilM
MLKAKSFLAVDCGANRLKLAEFDLNESGGLRLKQYGMASLGLDGAQESTREGAMLKGLQQLLGEKQFSSRQVNISAPGYHVFSKFVKLPPVDSAKVTQIVKYEAAQNVPWPLEEVVWDYQILGTTASGDLEVLLVAIKTDIVEGLYRTAETAGLRLSMVDVSSSALINAFRFNYSDLPGCTMLLDIGAKTSNLLFMEKGKVFARSINIGANMITQEFASEFHLKFDDAEQIKIEKGFVSLGGAYEEPDDPQAAAISKIARQIMTRLHIQMNQTINFYKTNQGGSPPERLFLSGGASIMPYVAQFFAEKLNLPVESVDYFNPLRNIQIDAAVNLEELAKVAHNMGELVGLGLRNLAHCPVELNLMPKSFKDREDFNRKKPYLLAAMFSVALVIFAVGALQQRIVEVKQQEKDRLVTIIQPLSANKEEFTRKDRLFKDYANQAEMMRAWLEGRTYWADLLMVFRECLMATEEATKASLGADTGIWIEQVVIGDTTSAHAGSTPVGPMNPRTPRRGMNPMMNPGGPFNPPPVGGPVNTSTNDLPPPPDAITHLTLKICAVDMTATKPEGNNTVVFEFLKQLQNRPAWFDSTGTNATAFRSEISTASNTFSAEVRIKLKRPILF